MSTLVHENAMSVPGVTLQIGTPQFPSSERPMQTLCTAMRPFTDSRELLSARPLRIPDRLRERHISNEQLKEVAARNPPAPEWYEGEEERPF